MRANALFPAGTAVMLDCGPINRAAVIRWQRGDLMGLCFEAELDEREVTEQVQRSSALAAWMRAREDGTRP